MPIAASLVGAIVVSLALLTVFTTGAFSTPQGHRAPSVLAASQATPGVVGTSTPAATRPVSPTAPGATATATLTVEPTEDASVSPSPTPTWTPGPTVTPSPTPLPQTIKVLSGWGEGVVSVNQFFGDPGLTPSGDRVRIGEGSTVVWVQGADEGHTVTFAVDRPTPRVFMAQPEDPSWPLMYNPGLFSPSLPEGPWDGTTFLHMELQRPLQEFAITFSKQGVYEYACLFHVEMTGAVEVVARGSARITTQSAIDQYVANHIPVHQDQVDQILASRSNADHTSGPRGTNLWYVRAGTSWRFGHLDILGFLPESLTIGQGDTVVWYADHVQPHTVTFFDTRGQGSRDFLVLQRADGTTLSLPPPNEPPSAELLELLNDPNAAPRLVLGPAGIRTGGPVHDRENLTSSGLFGEHPGVDVHMDKAWALTFVTPGTFEYQCLLHPAMSGTITVR